MRYRIECREDLDEDLLILAKQASPILERIEALLADADTAIVGYADDAVVRLDPRDIDCFSVEEGRVYAVTAAGKFRIRERLYRLEELVGDAFVKINQSALVNVSRIRRFDASIGGALLVTTEGGYRDYVSRRQLKTVKERIGF